MFNYQLMLGADKLMHLAGFAGVSAFIGICILLLSDGKRVSQQLGVAWLTLVTIGIIEEYRQYLDPGRSAEFLDAIANIAGITIGLSITLLVSYLTQHRQQVFTKAVNLYFIILLSLLTGLLYLNEKPFLTIENNIIQEKIKNLAALIGW